MEAYAWDFEMAPYLKDPREKVLCNRLKWIQFLEIAVFHVQLQVKHDKYIKAKKQSELDYDVTLGQQAKKMIIWIFELADREWRHSQVRTVF